MATPGEAAGAQVTGTDGITRDDALTLLRAASVEVWNDYRESGAAVPSLDRCDLRSARLGGFDLAGCDFIYADLSGCVLVDASLDRAWLTGTVLRNTRAQGARFQDAHLVNADLGHSHRSSVDVRQCLQMTSPSTGSSVGRGQAVEGTRVMHGQCHPFDLNGEFPCPSTP